MTKSQDQTNKQKQKKKHEYCKYLHRYSSVSQTQVSTSTINAYISTHNVHRHFEGGYPDNSHVVFCPNKYSFEPFMCLDLITSPKFHSLIHAYMYINDACNFIFTHQLLSNTDMFLTELTLQSL